LLYAIYGLWLQADGPIPGLEPASDLAPPNVQVWLQRLPSWLSDQNNPSPHSWFRTAEKNEQGQPNLTVLQLRGGAYFQLCYSDGITFVLDRSGSRIWVGWPASATLHDAATYLLGPVLGFVLRLRDVQCLHASAVAIDEQAVALVGPAGAGKSTTASALVRWGFALVSEDVVPVVLRDSTFLAQPGYPRIRLWPKSVAFLLGSPDKLPRLAPPWEKRYLDLAVEGMPFQSKPLPLAAVYLLRARTDTPQAPFVESVAPAEALITLVANSYTNYLLDQHQRAKEFEFLGKLVAGVPMRRLTPHTDSARLDQLCDVILDDFRSLAHRDA
jgi:hypothetical protein